MERSKMRKIQRSDSDDNDRSQSDNIPIDLIIEILTRLPAKSVVRCLSVSKLWSSIITTPDFTNSYATRSGPRVLLTFRKGGKRFVFSSPVHQSNTYPGQVENYQFTIPNNGWLRRYETVHGLIYLETPEKLTIWNPIMKRFFTLPKLEGDFKTGILGYDPIDGKYKVLCVHIEQNKIGILTLGGGAQESSWRILSNGLPKQVYVISSGRCINGVIYYKGYFGGLRHREQSIMSFDLNSEKFSLIKYPSKKQCDMWVSYEGRLALVKSTGSGVELWILEDQQWIYKHFPSPPCLKEWPFIKWKWMLKGVADTGEFIYSTCRRGYELISTRKSLYESFRIMYVDPKKNSFREVMHGGIAVDDIRRLDEVGFDLLKDLSVIPNHIDSLISL